MKIIHKTCTSSYSWTNAFCGMVVAGLLAPLMIELVVCLVCPVPFGDRLGIQIPDFGAGTYPLNER